MLVLSRRPSEKILFPTTNISVQVLSIRGSVVKIGVQAPPEVQVLRAELADGGTAPPAPAPSPSTGERLQRARVLLRELIGQREQGLGSAAAGEILAEMQALLEVPEATAARPTRLPRAAGPAVPDILAERATFKGVQK